MQIQTALVKQIMLIVVVAIPAGTSWGQATPPPEAPEEMKQLAFLVGTWKGTGTLSRGPNQSHDADVVETVQYKLQGSVLMIEGRGTTKLADGSESVVHDALALVSFDKAKKQFVIRTYRAGGEMLEPEIEVAPGKLVWSFDEPRSQGRIRFTLTVGDEGNWKELGEYSPKGQENWFQFFEMNLKKVD